MGVLHTNLEYFYKVRAGSKTNFNDWLETVKQSLLTFGKSISNWKIFFIICACSLHMKDQDFIN